MSSEFGKFCGVTGYNTLGSYSRNSGTWGRGEKFVAAFMLGSKKALVSTCWSISLVLFTSSLRKH